MNKKQSFTIGVVVGFLIAMLGAIFITEPEQYRQGQIDAMRGKWKYEMKIDTTYVEKK